MGQRFPSWDQPGRSTGVRKGPRWAGASHPTPRDLALGRAARQTPPPRSRAAGKGGPGRLFKRKAAPRSSERETCEVPEGKEPPCGAGLPGSEGPAVSGPRGGRGETGTLSSAAGWRTGATRGRTRSDNSRSPKGAGCPIRWVHVQNLLLGAQREGLSLRCPQQHGRRRPGCWRPAVHQHTASGRRQPRAAVPADCKALLLTAGVIQAPSCPGLPVTSGLGHLPRAGTISISTLQMSKLNRAGANLPKCTQRGASETKHRTPARGISRGSANTGGSS